MCIIIDNCVFGSVFFEKNREHSNFKPVKDWIMLREGKVVYGGTHYKRELPLSYLRHLKTLSDKRKTIPLPDKEVDNYENNLKKYFPQKKFNDPHIVAMALISECRLLCTNDNDFLKFIRDKDIYISAKKRPKVYKNLMHTHLLKPVNVPTKYL